MKTNKVQIVRLLPGWINLVKNIWWNIKKSEGLLESMLGLSLIFGFEKKTNLLSITTLQLKGLGCKLYFNLSPEAPQTTLPTFLRMSSQGLHTFRDRSRLWKRNTMMKFLIGLLLFFFYHRRFLGNFFFIAINA